MAPEGLSLILFFRDSLRSLWSPLVVLIGLLFALVGVITLADPRIRSRIDVASILIGLGGTVFGLAIAWRGCRLGVVKTPTGLIVRDMSGATTYESAALAGIGVGQHGHDLLPLRIVFPVLRMADDDAVSVMSLASYEALPGARNRVARAAATMAAWTGRPVLD